MEHALSGVKVLDLSLNLPGLYLAWLMACMGAQVLKVENPVGGDYSRGITSQGDEESPYFPALNRGKKSLALNLKDPAGRDILLRLLKDYDVLLEGFRPGVMARLGLEHSVLSRVQPRLIHLSISGYGQQGSLAGRAGHDINYLALAGVLDTTGSREGGLAIPGVQIADLAGGSLLGLSGVLAALYQRERTGKGQHVDTAMFDGSVSMATMVWAGVQAGLDAPRPAGMTLNGARPCYNLYRTKGGGWFSLGALEPKFWQIFCEALERPDLLSKQFAGQEVIEEVAAIFAGRTRDEWTDFWAGYDACCEPVLSMPEAVASSLVRERGMVEQDPQGVQLACPLKMSASPLAPTEPPPALGQDTAEVLTGLGLSQTEIEDMAERGVVGLA
ncbi:MAG: CoA transferase [Desulfarculaceae bacterium]|nr:CoA transferase [Desulfarculaceae bacterium]MCF8046891.1 CoA transferase [Desulfarculaceae bacterium]MCF8098825.1 CoA transferase [Desulfarculaceae bacterium]MCF8121938.1 CoA transferase [Desulfarculaceae bacterium]